MCVETHPPTLTLNIQKYRRFRVGLLALCLNKSLKHNYLASEVSPIIFVP